MSEKCLDYNNVHNNLFNTTQLLLSEFVCSFKLVCFLEFNGTYIFT
jgi:hypothetical protein